MKQIKWNLANGDLSEYSLGCGYVQKYEKTNFDGCVEMYHDAIYHVRLIDRENFSGREAVVVWESFERLTDARKRYAELKKVFEQLK